MSDTELYFVALPVDGEVGRSIRKLQEELKEKLGVSRQLKIPVHITLIPPFRTGKEFIAGLEKLLDEITSVTDHFSVKLNRFAYFGDKVIFVDLVKDPILNLLQKNIQESMKEKLDFQDTYNYAEFHPHVTLANRELTSELFGAAQELLKGREFNSEYLVKELTVYKSTDGSWIPFSVHKLKALR